MRYKIAEKKTIIIFGAGIAGLSAAHELASLGYDVHVHETLSVPGGFFRSERRVTDKMPMEYSWHGMGPWYHNTFEIMRQIPTTAGGTVYNKSLSRPIDFGIFPDKGYAQFYQGLLSIRRMFSLSWISFFKASWLMFKCWCSNERSKKFYSKVLASESWRATMHDQAYKLWRSCFGPWIGSDWTNVSLHTAGLFFRRQLFTKPSHIHPEDDEGPAWNHGQRDGWLLLRGPSSEVWFKHWLTFLQEKGVKFFWDSTLHHFVISDGRISSSVLTDATVIKGDDYILAVNPFAAAKVISETPQLKDKDELRLLEGLIQDGPHVQVSFRIAFAEEIKFPKRRSAIVLGNSEFNITLFAMEQAWKAGEVLGEGVKSLWTGTSCVGTVPGSLHRLPVTNCTKEQFIDEILYQIHRCESLNDLIQNANSGRKLRDFPIKEVEVWHEWEFSSDGIKGSQPKWVNTIKTQSYQPRQKTGVSNLFLAGAHTKTSADVWSIEGAVESGRRAAQCIDGRVSIIQQYNHCLFSLFSKLDDYCFERNLPHIFIVLIVMIGILVLYLSIH